MELLLDTIQSLLLTIFSILQDPVLVGLPIHHQANHDAADAYRLDKEVFDATARYWTDKYAGTKTRVNRLVQMGFDGA